MMAGETISEAAVLRGAYGEPSERAARKVLPTLDRHCRNFIALSPFFCLGTSRADGGADVSPRGDAPGFVRVVDDRTLLIPDRPGNNRLDSMSNIIANPNVGLIFFVPGIEETLRVNGMARVIRDPAALAGFAVNGKVPKAAILVEVREAFLHCAKALKRSRLWQDDYRVARDAFPTLGQIIKDQTQVQISAEEAEERIQEGYRTRLY